ncbi:hypothetical protein F5050DRAFT_1727495, partial [Lentinula boryana]
MFSSFLNAVKPASERSPMDQNDINMPGAFLTVQDTHRSPTLSPLIRGLDPLHKEEIAPGINDDTRIEEIEENVPLSPALEQLATLITAATITSEPIDTSNHVKLFTSSLEFYEQRGSSVPDSLQSLDMSTAMQSVNAVISSNKPQPLPAFRPGRQFGRQSTPFWSQSGCGGKPPSSSRVSPAKGLGKVASDEVESLTEFNAKLRSFQTEILDAAFDSLMEDTKCEKLDEASAFVKDALAHMVTLERRAKARATMADRRAGKFTPDITKETRDSLTQNLKTFHVQLCSLDAAILTKPPTFINADYAYNNSFMYSDQITQVLVLFTVICNMIIGLSTDQCEFLLNTLVICVKLGMSTFSSHGGNHASDFTRSQKAIISDIPSSLSASLKKFGAEGQFDLYASCPSCCYNHKATPLPGPNLYQYPEKCTNQIVGEAGMSVCGTELLIRRRDGTLQPIKPYLVSSLPDYLARYETYLQQSTAATDEAFSAILSGKGHSGARNVFEANFVKDFKGPDGKLFVDRGKKIRLAFSIHTDFFNPNRNTDAGAHQSIGIISVVTTKYLHHFLPFIFTCSSNHMTVFITHRSSDH